MEKRFIKGEHYPDGSTLIAGDENTQISAYGKIVMNVTAPTGYRTIMLNTVHSVPKFITKIGSAGLLQAKRVLVDIKRQSLHGEDRNFMLFTSIGDHYVLEDNTKGKTPVS